MDIVKLLLAPVEWPTSGLWEAIIKWFAGVGNIGLAIILLTLCLKVVLLPLDFWQRLVTRKMTQQQSVMAPEMEEVKRKYANNTAMLQQKQAEIYKKYNMNPANSCLSMLVYMVVTMVVFFTLFSGLGNISRSKINYEYYQLQTTYVTQYNLNKNATDFDTTKFESAEQYATSVAQNAVVKKYDEIRQGFLTIKNIWRPDNWSSVFPKGGEFLSSTGASFKEYTYSFVPAGEDETQTITYIYLSTNSAELTDQLGNKYVEPYTDLSNNIYAIKNADSSASNPTTIVIGDKTYNVVYAQVFNTFENSGLNLTYYYLSTEKSSTYKDGENTFVMPYAKNNTIFALHSSAPESDPQQVTINGKTYSVDYTKTATTLFNEFAPADQKTALKNSTTNLARLQFIDDFEVVTSAINTKYDGQWNGYLVLIILAGLITYLSSLLSTAGVKTRDNKGNVIKGAKPNSTMGIVMAVVMIMFTLNYTSAFAIYIITNSLISMLFTFLINLVINKIEDKKYKTDVKIADYVRR